jgi:hypothetical protein
VSPAVIATLGAVSGSLITATGSILIFMLRNQAKLRNDHLQRAFEKHLDRYERVFVAARTAQDSLRNYRIVSDRVDDRSDPFLAQILTIATIAAQEFCVSVTWTHNPGMLYLDIKLEERCLRVRELLLKWLAVRRISWGDLASIQVETDYVPVTMEQVRSLKQGDYRELRMETRRLILKDADDSRSLKEVDHALSVVIAELKTVMAY